MKDYDIVVIGGGAGGLVAAKESRRRGARVLMIQSGPIGGDCTFTGCVPSKALLSAAAERLTFDAAMSRVRRAISTIAATEDAAALAHEGIDVIDGYARFIDRRAVEVDGRRIRSDRFIVATGARAFVPPVPGLRESNPLTNETLFQLQRAPTSLTILGGGPIGCEMAQAFARLGSHVTIIEANDRLLPRDDPDAGAVVQAALTRDGVDVRTSTKAISVERDGDSRTCLRTDRGEIVVSTHLLAASGREPSGHGFGLEEIGVTVDDRGAVVVDDAMSTGVDGIWAVGDVTGRMQFTHVAGRMGWIAATNALSRLAKVRRFRLDTRAVPWTTFTSPEVAHVGLTLAQALQSHPDAKVAHLSMEHVDRAVAVEATDGFVTLIAAPKRGTRHLAGGRLVGATVVAPTAGELIHEAALAIQTNMFVGRLAQTTHAYPTWSMAMQQAALQFFGTSGGFTSTPIAEHASGGTS
ncbi:MAG: FAD-dependent oxidoreductase [Actinobacteria bacterium]|nr:FAD-dependent oxidoreductase [Actinomycetota bacterium]